MEKKQCYFLPLGGTEEIGMNFNLFGFVENGEEQWIVVDAGVSISKSLGISLKMASIDSVIDKNIIGIICTHAHEDHIGAIPFVLHRFNKKVPIYATKFTMKMIQKKLIERNISADCREVNFNSKFSVGEFNLEFVHVTHSIPESNMIVISFGGLTLLHTGDWKFDHDPVLGPVTNEKYIEEIGNRGVDYLICDSTNAMEEKATGSESLVKETLATIIPKYKGRRIIVSCFSSNVARIKTLIDLAKKYNRKICLIGRSFVRILEIALETRYLEQSDVIISQDDLNKYKPGEVLIMCTGSQGENKSVLHRVIYDVHSTLKIQKEDVVVFSAKVIPGNDQEIAIIKNNLMGREVTIVDTGEYDNVHVSGHPSQPELRRILDLVQPKHIIPVHGDRVHLVALEKFARSLGYKSVILPHNGAVIKLNDKVPEIIFTVKSGVDGLDGKTVVNLESQFLDTRKRVGENGCLLISIHSGNISMSNCGMLPRKIIESKYYTTQVNQIIKTNFPSTLDANEEQLNSIIKHTTGQLGSFFYETYGKNPIIIIHYLN